MTPVTSGRLFEMPLLVWHPDSSCWRTYGATSASGSTGSSVTLPTSGMTRSGALFEHPTWGHRTSGQGCSSLLGTPTSHPRTHEPRDVDHGIALANQVVNLPTPQARDGSHGGPQGKRYLDPARSNDLDDAVDALTKGLLPTPTVNDSRGGRNITANRRPGGSPNVSLDWTLTDTFWTGDRTEPQSNDGSD